MLKQGWEDTAVGLISVLTERAGSTVKARIIKERAINEEQDQTRRHAVKTNPVSPFTERTAPSSTLHRGVALEKMGNSYDLKKAEK